MKPCETMQNHVKPHETTQNYAKTTQNYAKPHKTRNSHKTMRSHANPCKTNCNHVKPHGTTGNLMEHVYVFILVTICHCHQCTQNIHNLTFGNLHWRRSGLNSAGALQGGGGEFRGIFTTFYTIKFRGLWKSGGARAPAVPPSSAPMLISIINS